MKYPLHQQWVFHKSTAIFQTKYCKHQTFAVAVAVTANYCSFVQSVIMHKSNVQKQLIAYHNPSAPPPHTRRTRQHISYSEGTTDLKQIYDLTETAMKFFTQNMSHTTTKITKIRCSVICPYSFHVCCHTIADIFVKPSSKALSDTNP